MNKYKIKMQNCRFSIYDENSIDLMDCDYQVKSTIFLNFMLNDLFNPHQDKVKLCFDVYVNKDVNLYKKRYFGLTVLDHELDVYANDIKTIQEILLYRGILFDNESFSYKGVVCISQAIINKLLLHLNDEQISKWLKLTNFYYEIFKIIKTKQDMVPWDKIDCLDNYLVVSKEIIQTNNNLRKTITYCGYKCINENDEYTTYHLPTNTDLSKIETLLKIQGLWDD